MRKQRDDSYDQVKNMVGERLDWNLKESEVAGWTVVNGRLQVILIDRGPRSVEDTRDYMKMVAGVANKEKIDLLVYHTQNT